MSIAVKSTIAGPVGTAPAAAQAKSPDIGGTRFVVDAYDRGRYLLKAVVLIGADAVAAPTYYAF